MRNLLFIIISILAFSCKSVENNSTDRDTDFLFAVNGDTVTVREFSYVYTKNNSTNNQANTRQDVEDYFELYKLFKLKIAEAKSQGIDTSEAYKKEFNTYKEELKRPYLTATNVTNKLIDQAYDRFLTEVNASHILLRLQENATPEDTLATYKKILEIKARAEEQGAFANLAREYSEDPSAAQNSGKLGYFTSFQMVYPFESAAYNTAVGEISDPVRTRFGYHIIKVHDKRKANGTVTVSHIMLRKPKSDEDTLRLRDKIFEIHEQAVGGATWEQLVQQYSEDVNSKRSGGKLQPFKVGQMPFEFQEAAFALNSEGEISDPVKTDYGWHIIKLENREAIADKKELEPLIESRIKQDSRAQISQKALINRLKKENDFKLNQEAIDRTKMMLENQENNKDWSLTALERDSAQVLFSIEDQPTTVRDFINFTQSYLKIRKKKRPDSIEALIEAFINERIISYEEAHLEVKYYDYKMLVKEYKEGIMLFNIMEDEVWSKAAKDTVGLKEYYQKHTDQYIWGKRIDATMYYSKDTAVLADIKSLILEGNIKEYSKKELEDKYNAQTALTLQIESGKFEFDYNEIIENVEKKPGIYLLKDGNRFCLLHIKALLKEEVKPFEKIKGIVISDYQNELEKRWVSGLKEKYRLVVNDKALKKVYDTLVTK